MTLTKLVNGVEVEMTPEEAIEFEASRVPVATIPQEVSRFQARAALHQEGLLEAVQALMEAPGTDPITVLAWQDATVFKRSSPTIAAIASKLELSESDIDDLFTLAATIDA